MVYTVLIVMQQFCSVRQVKTCLFDGEETMTTTLKSPNVVHMSTAASVAHHSTLTSSRISIIAENCMLRNCDWLAI